MDTVGGTLEKNDKMGVLGKGMGNTHQDQEGNKIRGEKKRKRKGYMIEAPCRGKEFHQGWASGKDKCIISVNYYSSLILAYLWVSPVSCEMIDRHK